MLGVQAALLTVILFITGCEMAAPGVTASTIKAAAEITLTVREGTYTHLCERVRLQGGTCHPSATV